MYLRRLIAFARQWAEVNLDQALQAWVAPHLVVAASDQKLELVQAFDILASELDNLYLLEIFFP